MVFQRARVDALIRERFSASYMSDAKWVRLLEALVELRPHVGACSVKLVWDEAPRQMRIPSSSAFGFDYYRDAMEGMISGEPRGFYTYREVEWIEFPAKGNDAEAIAGQIARAGKYELVSSETGLRLYAWR